MKVFKFGGASVKDAASIRNMSAIVSGYKGEPLVVVVSAMGKMTNALERLINSLFYDASNVESARKDIEDFHNAILWNLFPDRDHPIYKVINNFYYVLEELTENLELIDYDFTYDQLVCFGELLSTTIIHGYLQEIDFNVQLLDVQKCH